MHETKQENISLSVYFAELRSLWQELYHYQDLKADCSADAHKLKKIVEKDLEICGYRSSLSFLSEIASRHLQSQRWPFNCPPLVFLLK